MGPDRKQLEHEAKKSKEQFLLTVKVLIKLLKEKKPELHVRAKAVIQDCAEKKKQDPEYLSSSVSDMKRRLRATVGDVYWHAAEDKLKQLQRKKDQEKNARLASK